MTIYMITVTGPGRCVAHVLDSHGLTYCGLFDTLAGLRSWVAKARRYGMVRRVV